MTQPTLFDQIVYLVTAGRYKQAYRQIDALPGQQKTALLAAASQNAAQLILSTSPDLLSSVESMADFANYCSFTEMLPKNRLVMWELAVRKISGDPYVGIYTNPAMLALYVCGVYAVQFSLCAKPGSTAPTTTAGM